MESQLCESRRLHIHGEEILCDRDSEDDSVSALLLLLMDPPVAPQVLDVATQRSHYNSYLGRGSSGLWLYSIPFLSSRRRSKNESWTGGLTQVWQLGESHRRS